MVPLRRTLVLLAALGGAAATALFWWSRGVPVVLPDAPAGKLQCVSYSPYRLPGETPHDRFFRVSPERVEADLAQLASETNCVRTYSVQQGLDAVPEAARRHGLKVWLGVWIGRDARENEREIGIALDLARRYPDTIAAIIVGNEVLLRREQPPDRLAALLRQVKRGTAIPVTYADVWEFWLQNPKLADDVDFVTVHMLPYWEDVPVPIGNAVGHAMAMYDRVKQAFPGKEVVIGEAGWPSVGRHRQGAVPSLVNEARFVREFAATAAARGIRYNVIEAFDQPWKRIQEGAMGGYWGLFDSAGRSKFPLQGPVAEDPHWKRGFGAMAVGALAFVLLGIARKLRGGAALALLAAAGMTTGGALAGQWRYMVTSNRNPLEWMATGAYSIGVVAAALAASFALARWLAGRPLPPLATWSSWREDRPDGDAVLGLVRAFFLFGAAVMAVLLAFDPRYRDFPLALHAVPAAAFVLLAIAGRAGPTDVEERWLAAWLALSAPFILAVERTANLHAWGWAAVALAYALPVLADWRSAGRTSTSVASTRATAERS